jgi:hypothetical protein
MELINFLASHRLVQFTNQYFVLFETVLWFYIEVIRPPVQPMPVEPPQQLEGRAVVWPIFCQIILTVSQSWDAVWPKVFWSKVTRAKSKGIILLKIQHKQKNL